MQTLNWRRPPSVSSKLSVVFLQDYESIAPQMMPPALLSPIAIAWTLQACRSACAIPTKAAVDSQGLGIRAQNITSGANANLALTAVQDAVNNLGTVQGRVGAAMNRLQYAASQAQTMYVNVSASESRIRDADIATESSNLTKFNILTQSGLAFLNQANTFAQAVLMLLR